jgi:hypothetical protein
LDLSFRRGKGDKDVKKPVNKTIAAFLDFSDLIMLEFIRLRMTNSQHGETKKKFKSILAMKKLRSAGI